jgi:hypothetical protein
MAISALAVTRIPAGDIIFSGVSRETSRRRGDLMLDDVKERQPILSLHPIGTKA